MLPNFLSQKFAKKKFVEKFAQSTFDYMSDRHNNGRWSANSISETEEYNLTNENDQNQFNFITKPISINPPMGEKKSNNEILFTVTNLDVDKQKDENSPASPSITIHTDEDDRSIGNASEDNDFVPELTVVEQPKKLSLLLPETSNFNKNRR